MISQEIIPKVANIFIATMSTRAISFNSSLSDNISLGPHSYSVEKGITAIAGSPDGQMIAVVGRDSKDFFKITC